MGNRLVRSLRSRGDGGIDVKGREIKCKKQPVSSIFGKIG